jgi:hypothetical protein
MINKKVKPCPTYLSDMFRDIIQVPKPKSSHGIIFKRDKHRLTEEELTFLADNQIPY